MEAAVSVVSRELSVGARITCRKKLCPMTMAIVPLGRKDVPVGSVAGRSRCFTTREKRDYSIMKKSCLTFLVLFFLLTAASVSVPAQDSAQACVIVLEGQNQNRTVAGRINVECGFPDEVHSVPFGNWGVVSNYGGIQDTDQFRGWSHQDGPPTKQQWNSCTTRINYLPPNCEFYNTPPAPGPCRTQSSPDPVTHGRLVIRTNVQSCPPDVPGSFPVPDSYSGCQGAEQTVTQGSNHMTLYELDGWLGSLRFNDHDLLETLYFPGTSVTLTGCTYDGCPEQESAWVNMQSSTDEEYVLIEAQLSMKASAFVENPCAGDDFSDPVIDSFTANPATITTGQSATLTWTTTNATSVSISGITGALEANGSTTVSPTETTTYTLTAHGASITVRDTVTVTVNPPDPVIDTFTASSTSITSGTEVTLTWTTTNATSVSIPGTSGTLEVDGSTTVSPSTPTTYTLTASGASGTTAATATVTINISGWPTAALTANPATITAGQSAALTWTTSDATSVSIDQEVGAVTPLAGGSTSVSPTTTTTYTLTAGNTTGNATAAATVTVNPADPVIDTFTASATSIDEGGSTTLSWTTTNAASVSISGVTGALAVDGSKSVTPTATTTYTLTATGASGTTPAISFIIITVIPPDPVIDTFTASSTSITSGTEVTLTWTTTDAVSVSIPGTSGTLAVDGSTTVSPTTPTTYTLTASGATGTTAATASVTIHISGWPTATLTANPAAITSGQSATLTWTTIDATSVAIDQGVGAVTPLAGGSTTVSPTATTTYTLTAGNTEGSVTSAAAVTVNPPDPVVDTFTASSTSVTEGTDVTLTWTTSNADGVRLQENVGGLIGWQNRGSALAADGSTTVSRATAGSEEYRIAAYSDAADAFSPSITVTWTVPTPDPVIDSFSASSTLITVGQSTTLSWSTTNATSTSIDQGVGSVTPVASGSKSVTPTATTTYTLTAGGGPGATAATATVTVKVKPRIDSFTASSTTITVGQSSTLRWRTTNATSTSINKGVGSVTPVASGSKSVTPTETTTYTLTAGNAAGSNTRTVTIRVKPRIDSFSADPTTITAGGSSTLEWETTNATSTSINKGVGSVTPVASGSESVSPTETTTYTLTARNSAGRNTRSVKVTVTEPDCPVIGSFTASSTSITVGGSTTLRWTTTDATSTSIDQGVGSVTPVASGSKSVSPATTTKYTLTAGGVSGCTAATDAVTVKVKPRIDSFTADAATITEGQSTTLRWTTTNATSVSIPGTSGTLAVDGDTSISPTTTTTYTLTASNADGSNTATKKVTVVDPPVIDSFSASKTTITEGQSTKLSWTTTDATSVTISTISGTLALDGSRNVSPTTTTTYTLTAKNSADTPATVTDTVTITVNPRPPTASLYADPEEVFNSGDAVTLTWSTTNATSASIDQGVGSVTPVGDGSTTVYPDTTTTYTLTASGPGGSATDTATVYTVDFQRTLSATLTASSTTITQGGSTTLSWTTEGADSASIDQGVGAVTPVASGSRSVSPTATTKYTLTATSGEGEDAVSVTAAVTITVNAP